MQLIDHVSITVPDLARAALWPRRDDRARRELAAGGASEGAPGLRDHHPQYYAAFLRDPAGNRIEAVYHHASS
jgi:catechol 2,3-dioxygenase-like lactoylglutathione lyase family enzyme